MKDAIVIYFILMSINGSTTMKYVYAIGHINIWSNIIYDSRIQAQKS